METWVWVVLLVVIAVAVCGFVMSRQMRDIEARGDGDRPAAGKE